jgi:hypothetical protein
METSILNIADSADLVWRNKGRVALSRARYGAIKIVNVLQAGRNVAGCFVCCDAPACCPLCSSICICCDDAEYIKRKRDASKYVLIRENSLEWNEPGVVMKNGSCFGLDPCQYDVQDKVTVLYFDDPMFERITGMVRERGLHMQIGRDVF